MDANLTTILVATVSGGGGALVVREVIGGVLKMGRGIAGRVRTRQTDLVTQLADAESEKEAAEDRFDAERRNRRNVEVYAWGLERKLIQAGIPYTDVAQPAIEETTMTRAQVNKATGRA